MSQIILAGKGLLYAAAVGLGAWFLVLLATSAVGVLRAPVLDPEAGKPVHATGPKLPDSMLDGSRKMRIEYPDGSVGRYPPTH